MLGDEDDVDATSDVTKDEDVDGSGVGFSGKKKSSKSKKGSSLFPGSAFGAIGDDDDDMGSWLRVQN